MKSNLLRLLFLTVGIWLWAGGISQGHVVEQLYSDWEGGENFWELEVQFDAGYALPETRNDPDLPPPSRDWLMAQSSEKWAALREEAARYLREMLWVRQNGREVDYRVTFPDWEQFPPEFPKLLNGLGYFRVVLANADPGRVEVGLAEGPFPKLVVAREGEFLLLEPGESLQLREGAPWWRGAVAGFREAMPPRWEALLVVLGIFFYRPAPGEWWRRWLVFLVVQCLSMALVAAGILPFPEPWSGLALAISLVFLGLGNFYDKKGGVALRMMLVALAGFFFGIDGMEELRGFVDGEDWIPGILAIGLGVALGQMAFFAFAWLCSMKWHHHETFRRVCRAGSVLVIATGIWLAVNRMPGALG